MLLYLLSCLAIALSNFPRKKKLCKYKQNFDETEKWFAHSIKEGFFLVQGKNVVDLLDIFLWTKLIQF